MIREIPELSALLVLQVRLDLRATPERLVPSDPKGRRVMSELLALKALRATRVKLVPQEQRAILVLKAMLALLAPRGIRGLLVHKARPGPSVRPGLPVQRVTREM